MVASALVFFVIGVLAAAIGPVLPDLAANTGSTLVEVGSVFSAIFLGGFVAQLLAGPASDRWGQRPILLIGLVLCAIGILGVSMSKSLPLAVASMLLAGFGDGAIIMVLNIMAALVFASRSVVVTNLLNVFFGVGAIAGPAFAGYALATWGTGLPILWVTGVLLFAVVPYVARLRIPAYTAPAPKEGTEARGTSVYGSPLLWAIGVLLMLYVGSEIGTGGWTATYIARTTTLGVEAGALITSGFWLSLTGGRILAALLGRWARADTVLLGSLGGVFVGALLLTLSAGNVAVTIAALVILGLSFGPVYPTVITLVTATFRQGPGKAAGVVVAMGSIGGMVLPWLQGVLLEGIGPRASATLVAGSALTMLALYVAARLPMLRRSFGALVPGRRKASMATPLAQGLPENTLPVQRRPES
jgi:fucose permease